MPPDQEAGARALLDRWLENVIRRDAPSVAALYHPEAQLWGTIAAHFRDQPEQIRDYFDHFLDRHRMQAEYRDVRLRSVGEVVLAGGHYVFRWQDSPNGDEIKARARFTFVLARHDGGWSIHQHHSSAWVLSGI